MHTRDSEEDARWPTILGVSVGAVLGAVVVAFVALTLVFLAVGGKKRLTPGIEVVRAMEKALWVMTFGLVKPQTKIAGK